MKATFTIQIILLLFLVNLITNAQQEVLYTQYVYNELTINPAYAGYHDALNISLNSRKQWIGLEGAPMTITLAGHTVINRKNPECENFSLQRRGNIKPTRTYNKVGLGFLLYNDRIGVDNTLQGSFSYSYKILINENRLSFGLQGSVLNYTQDFTNLEQNNMDDPVFVENIQKTMINFGAGVFFDNDRYYVGFSSPQILKNSLDNTTNNKDNRQLRQFFLTGGYLFYLNKFLKYKPSFMFRYTEEIPFQLDFNSMIIFNDMIYFGLSYRNKNTVSTIFQVSFNQKLRIGLAYDYNIINEFKKATNGTAEVLLYYNFRNSVHKVVNPRYF